MKKMLINTDGGARGNPGLAAIGVVIKIQNGEEKEIVAFGKKIGITTNNVAEYRAIVEALKWLIENIKRFPEITKAEFFLDSNLVVNQLNGNFKVKDQKLINLFYTVRELEKQIDINISYNFVPRIRNLRADFFVNQALNEINI